VGGVCTSFRVCQPTVGPVRCGIQHNLRMDTYTYVMRELQRRAAEATDLLLAH
jgi:hypothetical protein